MRNYTLQEINKQVNLLPMVYQEISMDEFIQAIEELDIYDWFKDESILIYKVVERDADENTWIHIYYQKRFLRFYDSCHMQVSEIKEKARLLHGVLPVDRFGWQD